MSYDIQNTDCLSYMRAMDPGSVDAVVTDPPYGMGFQSGRSKSGPRHAKIAGDEKIDPAWIVESERILDMGGALIMFCNWETSCEWRRHIEAAGLTVVSQVIWDREHHGMGDLAGGFAPMHDVVWYATKGRRVFAGERPKSVLRHRRPSPGADFGHPTCKPLSLMREIIDAIKSESHLPILDPFMGSGTTGAACVMAGVNFLGTEIDATYFDIAARRIAAAEKGVVSNSLPGQMTLWDNPVPA